MRNQFPAGAGGGSRPNLIITGNSGPGSLYESNDTLSIADDTLILESQKGDTPGWTPEGGALTTAATFVATSAASLLVEYAGLTKTIAKSQGAITVSGLADQTVAHGAAVSIDAASAFSGTVATYSIVSGPDWLSINPATGAITGTAPGSDVTVSVTVRASNNAGSVTDTFDVAVAESTAEGPLALPVPFSVPLYRDNATYFTTWTPQADEAPYWSGATIYVDAATGNDGTGDGSLGAPYRTADAAIAAANSLDILSFAPGTYDKPSSAVTKDLMFKRTGSSGAVAFGTFADLTGKTIGTNAGTSSETLNPAEFGGVKVAGFIRLDLADGEHWSGFDVHPNDRAAAWALGIGTCYVSSLSYFTFHDGATLAGLRASGDVLVWLQDETSEFAIAGAKCYMDTGVAVCGNGADNLHLTAGATLIRNGSHSYGTGDSGITVNSSLMLSFETLDLNAANNTINYEGSGLQNCVEVGIKSYGSGANNSTGHGTGNVLRIGGEYKAAPRLLHDIHNGYQFTFSSTIEQTVVAASTALRAGVVTDMVYGDLRISGTYSNTEILNENTGWTPVEVGLAAPWPY